MSHLRQKVIKLAHQKPELRAHLLPLLFEAKGIKWAVAKKQIYLKHRNGGIHDFRGSNATNLYRELTRGPEGRPGPLVLKLVESGYEGFIGPDGDVWDFEGLEPEHFGTYH
jgi:hypothetical protein